VHPGPRYQDVQSLKCRPNRSAHHCTRCHSPGSRTITLNGSLPNITSLIYSSPSRSESGSCGAGREEELSWTALSSPSDATTLALMPLTTVCEQPCISQISEYEYSPERRSVIISRCFRGDSAPREEIVASRYCSRRGLTLGLGILNSLEIVSITLCPRSAK
jgi:hypothetical protein